jgi:hypothetical protein
LVAGRNFGWKDGAVHVSDSDFEGAEIGDLVEISAFFASNPSEADIGCNLYPHPGIPVFRELLESLSKRPDVARVFVELIDSGDTGIGFTDRVWVVGKPDQNELQQLATTLRADLLDPEELGGPEGLPDQYRHLPLLALFWD